MERLAASCRFYFNTEEGQQCLCLLCPENITSSFTPSDGVVLCGLFVSVRFCLFVSVGFCLFLCGLFGYVWFRLVLFDSGSFWFWFCVVLVQFASVWFWFRMVLVLWSSVCVVFPRQSIDLVSC